MSQIGEYIKIAVQNIRNNRGRSVLTMLGIIIGISSVIMVISAGNGFRKQFNEELDSMAGGQLYFYADSSRKDTTVSFSEEDVEYLIDNVEGVKGAYTYVSLWGTAEGPKTSIDAIAIGGNTSLIYNTKQSIIKGRYFNEGEFESGAPVCVLSESHAKKLFGTSNVVGLQFDMTMWGITHQVEIVGIREDSPAGIISMLSGDGYIQAECPYTFLCNKYGLYLDEFTNIYVYCENPEKSAEIAKSCISALETRTHSEGTNQIMMESFADASSQYDTIIGGITAFISLVAAISLIVGGIGVMNIMLVSVTERTREIGIRKALGARTKSIMWQFLAEAGIITLIGGVVGIVLGITLAFIIGAVLSITPDISIVTILLASAFSCGIGMFFGIYPAKKAAKLSPIEALRHE